MYMCCYCCKKKGKRNKNKRNYTFQNAMEFVICCCFLSWVVNHHPATKRKHNNICCKCSWCYFNCEHNSMIIIVFYIPLYVIYFLNDSSLFACALFELCACVCFIFIDFMFQSLHWESIAVQNHSKNHWNKNKLNQMAVVRSCVSKSIRNTFQLHWLFVRK